MSAKRSYILLTAIMLVNVLLVGLAWQYRSSRVRQAEARLTEAPILRYGEQAPEYSGVDAQGQPVKISKGADRFTLLVFFKPMGVNETLVYLNALDARHKAEGLRIIGISGGSVEQTQRFISQSRLSYPVVADSTGDVHRMFKFHPHHDHGGTLLLNRDLRVDFASDRIALPDLLRQLAEQRFLGQIDYASFQPSLDAFRVGGGLPSLRLIRVGSHEGRTVEGITEPNATFVFLTAQCASCRSPEQIQRLGQMQEQLSGKERLYVVFSSNFPMQELEYYQRATLRRSESYIALDEIPGIENRYATRYPRDWGPVVVRTGRDGKIVSVTKLRETDSIGLLP